MLLTPWRLIALRVYNVTLGRAAFFRGLLRLVLLKVLVDRPEMYVQSARYFTLDQLDDDE